MNDKYIKETIARLSEGAQLSVSLAYQAKKWAEVAEYLQSQLAQRDAELAAVNALLDEALEEFADCIPYSQPYFDKKWGYSETLKRLQAQRKNVAPRAAQLAQLIEAVGEWMKCRDSWLESSNSDYDRTEAEYEVSKDKLATAYRAAFPPEQTP